MADGEQYEEEEYEEEEKDHTLSVFFLFFMVLLALVLLLGRALHNRPKLNSFLSEPAMTLLVSVFFSFLVKIFFAAEEYINIAGVDEQQLSEFLWTFSGEVFFMVFLPPIMFNSGYELKRELFFRHLKPIVSFAVLGTALAGIVTGLLLWGISNAGWIDPVSMNLLELLTFGSLITATDTVSVLGVLNAKKVNPHLFSLVFGESALNDAVAIVLFTSCSRLVRMGGIDTQETLLQEVSHFLVEFLLDVLGCPLMGMALSFVAALMFKKVIFEGTPVMELSLYLLLMYIPFIVAEVLGMSGIVTIFFTGIFARRYIEPNVSDETQRNAQVIFNLVAYLAEMCIFLNLGLSVFGFSGHFHWAFIGFAFLASLVGRAMSIYPISFLFNRSLVEQTCEAPPNATANRRATVDVVLNKEFEKNIQMATLHSGEDADEECSTGVLSYTPEESLDKVIPTKFMHFLWFAGLRGAVAYACARDFPDVYGNKDEVVAATMVIVFFSVIVMGACCEPLLHKLDIRMGVDNDEYMREWRNRRSLTGPLHRLEKRYVYDVVVRGENDSDSNNKDVDEFHLTAADGTPLRQSRGARATERATTASSTVRTLTGN